MQPIGPPQSVRSLEGERVLLLGSSSLIQPLTQSLEGVGGSVETAACSTRQHAIEAITGAESRGAVHHLVLVDRDPAGEHMAWPARKEARVESLFFGVQHWLNLREAAGDLASSSLTALVDLGGDFGRSGQIAQVEGGAICGLLKNLNREYPETFMRVVDADADLSEATLCERFVAEMGDAAGPVEISLSAHGRQVAAVAHAELTDSLSDLPGALQRGSVWIVTGGARGVTAACAQQLAARYGVTMVLVGSTQPEQIDSSWLSLEESGLKSSRAKRWSLRKIVAKIPVSVGGKLKSHWKSIAPFRHCQRQVRQHATKSVTWPMQAKLKTW